MIRQLLRGSVVSMALFGVLACNSGLNNPYNPTAGEAAFLPVNGSVGFATIQQQILIPYCIQCHQNFISYQNIVNSGYLIAGNAGQSLLCETLANGTMPANGVRLSPNQISELCTWVQNGAIQ